MLYEDVDAVAKEFKVNRPAIIFNNDCVVVTGDTLLQAFDRLEVLELTAHSIIDCKRVGDIVHISQDEVRDLKKAFKLVD